MTVPSLERNEAGYHAHGGGFAGAVRTEKTEHFAAFHREGNAVNCPFGPENLYEILNSNHIWQGAHGAVLNRGRTLEIAIPGAKVNGFLPLCSVTSPLTFVIFENKPALMFKKNIKPGIAHVNRISQINSLFTFARLTFPS